MTELEKQLLAALEQMQAQQQKKEEALQQMFEYTARQSAASGAIKVIFSEFERNRSNSKRKLEQVSAASKQLDYSIRGLQGTKRDLDQAITSARNTSVEAQKMNEPRFNYSQGRGLSY